MASLVLIGAAALFVSQFLIPARENRFDLYPHWVGSRAFWNGQSPYDPAVNVEIQTGMFGGVRPPEFDQHNFIHPAYTAILIAPLLLLPSSTAIALWLGVQIWATAVTPFVWMIALRWRIPPFALFALLLGLILVFRYPMINFIVGQYIGTMTLLISVGLLLLLARRDVSAGVVFAVAATPPTIAGFLAVALLGAYALVGRWRGLAAFAGVLAVLFVATVLRIGWWVPDYLRLLGEYSRYANPIWAPGLLGSPVLSLIFAGAVVAWLMWNLTRFRRCPTDPDCLTQYAGSAIVAVLLLLPQTGTYTLTLLMIPLIFVAYRTAVLRRMNTRRALGLLLLLALVLVSPWLFHAVEESLPNAIALALPLEAGLLLTLSSPIQDKIGGRFAETSAIG